MSTAATPLRRVGDAERRARLGVRSGLAPGTAFDDLLTAARGLTVLHATEPATIHLALRARVPGLTVDAVESALHDERSIVKQGAMRQTLFGFPRDLLPAALGSVAARVARSRGTRFAKDVEIAGIAADGAAWVAETGDAIVGALTGADASAAELRALVPATDRTFVRGAGRWGAEVPVAPELLALLHFRGLIARAGSQHHWRLSRPRWTATQSWLGAVPEPLAARAGYAELVGRWLRTFGPGTEADLRWWLGDTLGAVRRALADVGAVPVGLDGTDATGWLLPDDVEEVADPGDWVALLPTLDPTVMGWHGRDFYLGPHRDALFDSVGNAGTTIWWSGRVVGAWMQEEDAVVRPRLLEPVPARVVRAVEDEAERLTAWLDGVRVTTLYVSAGMRGTG